MTFNGFAGSLFLGLLIFVSVTVCALAHVRIEASVALLVLIGAANVGGWIEGKHSK
jgi:hypothetical protein